MIEIRAEIKLGERLREMDKNKGDADPLRRVEGAMPPTLSELGITYNLVKYPGVPFRNFFRNGCAVLNYLQLIDKIDTGILNTSK